MFLKEVDYRRLLSYQINQTFPEIVPNNVIEFLLFHFGITILGEVSIYICHFVSLLQNQNEKVVVFCFRLKNHTIIVHLFYDHQSFRFAVC